MLFDERTAEDLDFAGIRTRVVDASRTQRGRALAAAMEPIDDFETVRIAQRRTAAMRELISAHDSAIMEAADPGDAVAAAQRGQTLAPSDLRAIGDALAAAAAAHAAAREESELQPVIAPYVPLRDLQRALIDAIDERGNVLDRASPALARARRHLAQAQADARDRVAGMLRSSRYAKAIQDAVVTIRDGRFVIPVKADFASIVPGIVHDTSASGQTLFVEPLQALDANNRVRTSRIEEDREIARVLGELSRRVGADAPDIEADLDVLAALDVLVAKARVAQAMDAMPPQLVDSPELAIVRGRHPLLGARAVAQSLALEGQTRMLVISGPNMGGKTVALKMVGLFVAMTYCGLQLPAAGGTRVGRFARVISDIGDRQSIAVNLSSYGAHLQRMREMLDLAGQRTLILVDEIGGGTEPSAGAALAIAMLERLLESGVRGVVTTHATELKLFAHRTPGALNAGVRFDPRTFAPTFELHVGMPGQSLAFALAKALGIEAAVVDGAERLLERRERDYESALAELSMRAAELDAQRARVDSERAAGAQRNRELERARADLDAQRERLAVRFEAAMQQALRDFTRELERRSAERGAARPKVTRGQAALLSQTVDAIRADLGIVPEPAPTHSDEAFPAGMPIRIVSLRQDGVVAEDYGDTLLVAVGAMKTVVKKSDVAPAAGGTARASRAPGGGEARAAAAARTSGELDVRGQRYAQAEPLVERWLDDAAFAGVPSLRLIHGKGTGMLGRGLQEYLRSHPAVKSVRYGNEDEGSAGVTIVELHD